MPHPDDARLLRRADAQRGEAGGWSVYWEGTRQRWRRVHQRRRPGRRRSESQLPAPLSLLHAGRGPAHGERTGNARGDGLHPEEAQHRRDSDFRRERQPDPAPTRQGALAPPQTLDLLAFADQSVAEARRVGTFAAAQEQFFGGCSGAGPMALRPAQAAADARQAARHAARDNGRAAGRRILPHHQRSLSRTDRRAKRAVDAHTRRRLLRVRLLPVRRAVVLDARLGPRH